MKFIIFTLLIVFCNFGNSTEIDEGELDGIRNCKIKVAVVWTRVLDFCPLPAKGQLSKTCSFVRNTFITTLEPLAYAFECLPKTTLEKSFFFRLCHGLEPTLADGNSGSSQLWKLAHSLLKTYTADLTAALKTTPTIPDANHENRIFALAIANAVGGMAHLPSTISALGKFREFRDKFSDFANCTTPSMNGPYMHRLLIFTQLPEALANQSELNEQQNVCLVLARAYKRFLCFKSNSGAWYQEDIGSDVLYTFLRGPDFPSNPSKFNDTEETQLQVKEALRITDEFLGRLTEEATTALAITRRALLS